MRSGGVILPRTADWLEATKDLRKAFTQHNPEEVYQPVIALIEPRTTGVLERDA